MYSFGGVARDKTCMCFSLCYVYIELQVELELMGTVMVISTLGASCHGPLGASCGIHLSLWHLFLWDPSLPMALPLGFSWC